MAITKVTITKVTQLHWTTIPYFSGPQSPTETLLAAEEPTQADGDWYNKNRAGILQPRRLTVNQAETTAKATAMAEAAAEMVAKQPNQEEEQWQAGYDLKQLLTLDQHMWRKTTKSTNADDKLVEVRQKEGYRHQQQIAHRQ